ncbi:NAD(P)H-dependent oxidoreductase subunit E [Celeribacter sp.]|uniref:NAD(P)H-dependent oxidoreductase subunit E n=1 Tax=Celeribacter sp. TaxID=1890673 RepID=UPI003A8D70E8
MSHSPFSQSHLDDIFTRHRACEGPLLPILHDMMAAFGHIPDDALAPLADALRLTRAEVYGVVSFYHDFKTHPDGHHVIKLCRAEACQSVGAAQTQTELLSRLGLKDFGTTRDGRVTVEAVYCLGLCACGPAALVNEQPRGRVSAQSLATEVSA